MRVDHLRKQVARVVQHAGIQLVERVGRLMVVRIITIGGRCARAGTCNNEPRINEETDGWMGAAD